MSKRSWRERRDFSVNCDVLMCLFFPLCTGSSGSHDIYTYANSARAERKPQHTPGGRQLIRTGVCMRVGVVLVHLYVVLLHAAGGDTRVSPRLPTVHYYIRTLIIPRSSLVSRGLLSVCVIRFIIIK
jgi:hypothetical protein